MQGKSLIFKTLALILAAVGGLFLLLPILHIVISLSLKELLKALRDREVWSALWVSFESAFWAVFIGLFLGVPIGYLLARGRFRGKRLLESVINLPIAIPHVAAGIALLSLFNDKTLVGKLFKAIHITFVDTIYGVIIAMLFVSFSFIISASIVGFSSVEKELELVAQSLGADRFYTFLRVTLPLAFPAILRGAILAFARALSEVGAILIIAYYPKTAQILLYERFEEYGLNAARPITVIVIFASLIIFFLLLYLNSKFIQREER